MMTARELAERLMGHPDALVEICLPSAPKVRSAIYFPNDDGSMESDVWVLLTDLGGPE